MAVIARSHGVRVEVARFEEWEPAGRRFDLVVSGQAWHWVDPSIGPEKAADVLEPGGRLAVFWNRPRLQPGVRSHIADAYERIAPMLTVSSAVLGTVGAGRTQRDIAAIERSNRYETVKDFAFASDVTYSRDSYLDQLQTHSDHIQLPRAQLDQLLEAVGSIIDESGDHIIVRYETVLIEATRHQGG